MEPITKFDPEEEKIRQENLIDRQRGYSKTGVYNMMKGVAIQAIKDYIKCKKIIAHAEQYGLDYNNLRFEGKHPKAVIQECREYFKTRNFRQIFGETDVNKLCERIMKFSKVQDDMDKMEDKEREKYMNDIINGIVKV